MRANWPPAARCVTVADVDDVGAKSLADEIGGKAWAVDLLDVAALEDLQLEVDILVNNAGVQSVSPIAEFPPEKFRLMLALMVEAPFLLIRAALPHMYRQRIRPDHQHLVGARAAGLRVQGRLRHRQARARRAVEGDGAGGRPARRHEQLRQPGYVRTPLVTKQIADQARIHGIPEDQVVEKIC